MYVNTGYDNLLAGTRSSGPAATVTTVVAPTAPMPVEAPQPASDSGASASFDGRGSEGTGTAPGGTPVDAPATIAVFSAANTVDALRDRADRIQAAIAPEKVFGTEQSDVPGASPANLARELARASTNAIRSAGADASSGGAAAA